MEAENSYFEYKLDKPTKDSKDFFSSHPMKNRWFENIFLSEFSSKKWVINLNDVPEEPSKSKLKADASKPSKKKRRININYGAQLIFGDNNTVINPTSINYNTGKEDIVSTGDTEEKEESTEVRPTFWKDRIRKTSNHSGCGKNVSPRPNLDNNIYREHLKHHEVMMVKVSEIRLSYLSVIFKIEDELSYKKAIKNTPSCDDESVVFDFLESFFRATFAFRTTNVDIKDDETTFNSLLLYPFIEAVATFVAKTVTRSKAGFRRGKVPLMSMAKQLKFFEFYDEESRTYLADDRSKYLFGHHKDLLGFLSMLKQITDSFHKASIDTFSKIKVFFVHAAGASIRLWSLRYEPQGPVFNFWLETTLEIKLDINDKSKCLPGYLNFFWVMKLIEELTEEHKNLLCNNLLNQATSSSHSLSSVINPSILKSTEEKDKAGLHKLGPFYDELSST
ncbi:hypothetical protein MFLAVUS_003077 [Mucor flavus]|uniref:Uncharacterized protein n=1 Tax=Mucor flavus TaxID=439312 RepID=A0ABP9YS45_9FUNG